MQTLVVIPTYNEIANLQKLTQSIRQEAPETDILIVDDNSPDGTGKLADKLAKRNHHLKVIHRDKKLGLGSAYIRGFKYALSNNYDFVFEMDADFSHQPKYIPKFLAEVSMYHLVLGSRYIKGGGVTNWGTFRRTLSSLANLYARTILRLPFQDLTGGFKCFSRQALLDLDLDKIRCEGYAFQIETTYRTHRMGHPIKEIPIVFCGRKKGKSKISRAICLEAIWKVPLLRFLKV